MELSEIRTGPNSFAVSALPLETYEQLVTDAEEVVSCIADAELRYVAFGIILEHMLETAHLEET